MPTATYNHDAHINDFKRLHGSYELFAYKQLKKALDEQIRPVISHVKAYGGISSELSDMLVQKSPMNEAYKNVYVKVGVRHAGYTRNYINRLGRKGLLSFLSEKWRQLMSTFFENESATRISDVTETTRERIRQVLSDSQDLPISQQANYIVDTLSDPAFNRNRAMVIARTESTTAANKGAELGNDDADYVTVKRWLSVEDSRTRTTHIEADGQEAGIDGLFIVGGYPCRYPGDISLPVQEVANCRCSVLYIPVLDASGLPVMKRAA
jgi:hypothetical protein